MSTANGMERQAARRAASRDAAATATLAWPRAIFALAVAAHAVMFLSLFFGYLNPLFHSSDHERQAVDFFSIYRGGTFILHGQSIYSFTPADSVPYAAPYRYLAYTGAVAFNAMPPWPGYWLWVSLIEVMLFADAWLTYRLAADKGWGWIAAAMWFAFTPLYVDEYMRQWSFLMGTLMLWTAAPLIRGRPSLASVPWGISVMIKTNSALLGPIFLRLRQWRLLMFVGAAIVVLNAPYFAFHPQDGRWFWDINFGLQYWNQVPRQLQLNSGDLGGIAYIRNAYLILDQDAANVPHWLERTLVFGVLGVSLAATFLPRKPDLVVLFALWSSLYFLTYFSWEHHYVMLLPAFALLVALRPEYRPVAIFAFVFVALPAPYFIFEHFLSDATPEQSASYLFYPQWYWPQWAGMLDHATKPVPVFVMWASLASDQIAGWWRERRA